MPPSDLPASSVPDTPSGDSAPGIRSSVRALLREIIETALLTAIIYVLVNFATGRFRVENVSMKPNFHPGEYVLVDKIGYMLRQPQRGDVVVFHYPLATERDFIKRIIGLPGETITISAGKVHINGKTLTEPYIAAAPDYEGSWTLGPGQFFVLGDNRGNSSDSHSWGPLEQRYIVGHATVIYWPLAQAGWIHHYSYDSPSEGADSATSGR